MQRAKDAIRTSFTPRFYVRRCNEMREKTALTAALNQHEHAALRGILHLRIDQKMSTDVHRFEQFDSR